MENNWTITQTQELFRLAEQTEKTGRGLKEVFDKMAEKVGRSSNSVRNFYYSQLKMFELLPGLARDLNVTPPKKNRADFELFGESEINELMEKILVGKGSGKSVRAVIAEMALGDGKKALRLQNKYRSMLLHHRAAVEKIMTELKDKGIKYYDPYRHRVGTGGEDNIGKLTEYIGRLDEREAGNFLKLLKAFND